MVNDFVAWFDGYSAKEKDMLPENRIPTHPGEVLLDEVLVAMNLSQMAFAAHIDVPVQRVNEIVRGKRGITPETAWLFAEGTRYLARILAEFAI